jgi:hypothetical protein
MTAEENESMKYMLMFCATVDGHREWEALPQEVRDAGFAKMGQWIGANADKLVMAQQLQDPQTASTVRFTDGKPAVTDGPFIEAKEIIGGFAVVDVADHEAAVELAKGWPGQGTVEVRPVVER